MLPLGDLIRDLDVRLVAGEAGLDHAVRWVHISELEDPTPWLSGGELLLTTGHAARATPAAARVRASCWPATGSPGLGLGTGFAHAGGAGGAARGGGRARLPARSRCRTRCRSSRSPRRRPRTSSTSSYAVLQRALSAHERLERIVLSERGLDGVASALASLIGGPALIFDARGASSCAARTAQPLGRRRPSRRCARAARAACAPARAAASRRRGELEGRALALPVVRDAAATARRPGALPEAWLIAAKDARRAERARPAHAAPGGDDRRARAAAPARGRRHRAPAGRRRADRAGVGRPDGRRARAAAGAVRAARPRRRARAAAAAREQAPTARRR